MTMIFGHRGFSGYYPENTMLAFEMLAAKTKADGIELDVQLSRDGEVVIMHDETLDRTTNGSGYVKDYTLKELKTLSVGVNFKGFYPRQTIPTLLEYLEFVRGTGLITNIELKDSIIPYPGMEEKVISLVREAGLEKRVWYSSFNHYSVAELLRLEPGAKCGLLTDTWLVNAGAYAASQKAATLNASSYFALAPGLAYDLHHHGVGLQAWTPNDKPLMRRLVEAGADVLITNYPDRAQEVIAGRGD